MGRILEHLNRNTAAVVQIGESVSNLGVTVEVCIRLDRSTSGKNAVDEEQIGARESRPPSVRMRESQYQDAAPCLLEPHAAFKIYSKGMISVRVRKPGDGNVFGARKAWVRLCHDFPVAAGTHRRLLSCAFSECALAIYASVAAENLHSTADELWEELSHRLCNASYRRALRLTFDTISWHESKELVSEFAGRVRAAALMLPEAVPDEIMVDRFVQSLPTNMQNLALSIPGTFDEVTARILMMSLTRTSEGSRTRFRNERVLQASEGPLDGGHVAAAPINARAEGGQGADWTETAKCYRCGLTGHIASSCPEKPSRMRCKEP